MVFTQGLWERLLLLPPGTSIIVELPIWIYLLLSIKTFSYWAPARNYVILYIIFSLFISIANGENLIEWIKYIRYFLYFYLIYASLWNTEISRSQWYKVFKLVLLLIIAQGLGSSIDLFFFNQRIEGHVGIMSSLGGTKASTFPLFIISMTLLSLYFLNQLNRKTLILMAIIITSSALVGYGSGKRAIYFIIPVFIVLISILSFYKLQGYYLFYRRIFGFILISLLILPVYFLGITNSNGLNYNLKGGESNSEIIEAALNYAEKYENTTTSYVATSGRSGTSLQILDKSMSSFERFVLGFGIDSYKDESSRYDLGIRYGIVGFTRDLLAGGWLLMILTVVITSLVILKNKSLRHPFTNSLRVIIFAIFIYTHFFYSADFTVHLKINFLLLLLMVLINSPVNQENLHYFIYNYFLPNKYI